jgi:hypothetical protein
MIVQLDFPTLVSKLKLIHTESFPFWSRLSCGIKFFKWAIKQRLKVEGGIGCGPGGMQELFMN